MSDMVRKEMWGLRSGGEFPGFEPWCLQRGTGKEKESCPKQSSLPHPSLILRPTEVVISRPRTATTHLENGDSGGSKREESAFEVR